MVYTTNVPLGPQRIKDTQRPIQGNFNDIYSVFFVNHATFNSGADTGKHTFVQFTQQTADPVNGATVVALYNKANTDTGFNELYFQRGNTTSWPITARALSGNGINWTYLPSGLVLKWGFQTTAAGTFSVQLDDVGVPVYGATPTLALAMPQNVAGGPIMAIDEASSSATEIIVKSSPAAVTFYWLTLGV